MDEHEHKQRMKKMYYEIRELRRIFIRQLNATPWWKLYDKARLHILLWRTNKPFIATMYYGDADEGR